MHDRCTRCKCLVSKAAPEQISYLRYRAPAAVLYSNDLCAIAEGGFNKCRRDAHLELLSVALLGETGTASYRCKRTGSLAIEAYPCGRTSLLVACREFGRDWL